MTNSSSTFKQVTDMWSKIEDTPIIAGRWSKNNLLQNQRTNVPKSRKSCYTGSSSAATRSTQQDTKPNIHFGAHLLKNLKLGLDLKVNIPIKEYLIGNNKPVKSVKKCGEFMSASMKRKGVSHEGVFPFCEERVLGAQRNRKISVRSFGAHAMMPSTPYRGNFEWSNPVNQTSFSFGGVARTEQCEYPSQWIITQPHRRDTELQPTKGAKKSFRELGLTYDQIIGLENLGLNVSRFLPRLSATNQHDPSIPPSFDMDGVPCYWCESHWHVAYGVAFILKEDTRVVGVTVQRNKSSTKLVLIQIATADVVLLIPMDADCQSVPKALRIIFRDPEIFKTGVQIEKNLRALWVDFQIESNSFVELNELLEKSWKKFGTVAFPSKRPLKLQAIASFLGYQIWETKDMTFTN